jgi:microcystin-dependent protein
VANAFIGEIRMFAGNFAPAGWSMCEGQLLPISEFDTLFNLIGTTYGGDGETTFALPDLRGRIPIHVGPGFTQAQTGGVEEVTLTGQQLPSHTHTAAAVSGNTNGIASPANAAWGSVTTGTPYTDQVGDTTMNPGALGNIGGNSPHSNMMPYLCVNFIIAMFGIFPST